MQTIFILGHTDLVECRQAGQNRPADPRAVLALGRSDDLDLGGRGSQGD